MGDTESIWRSRERLYVGIYTNAAAASDAVALQIKACIETKAEQGKRYNWVVCILPSG